MSRLYLVSYDIREPKRLRKVYRLMRGYGQHTQFSVFLCELSPRRRMALETCLLQIIQGEDQLLFIDLGPVGEAAYGRIESLGQAFQPRRRGAIIV